MEINLIPLLNELVKEIKLDEKIELPTFYYDMLEELKEVNNLSVNGLLTMDLEGNITFKGEIEADLILYDSISLDPVKYPISVKYDDIIEESCKKNENTLDIFEFLWENIVLEVPLQFTKVLDLSKYNGDGWKLFSEEEIKLQNNPFAQLSNDLKKE